MSPKLNSSGKPEPEEDIEKVLEGCLALTRLRADATLGVARGRVDLVLRLVPGLVLRLGPDCGHVDDSEEEGLPELAYEGTSSLSERAEEK